MTSPVLFLDIDGVLNTRPGSLDPDKLDLVRDIIKQTSCLVCLSSSWRLNPRQYSRISQELPIWRATPQHTSAEAVDWTPGQTRRREIQWFLNTHRDVRHYAVLDDYDEGWGFLAPAVVVCDPLRGLGPAEAQQAVAKLNNPMEINFNQTLRHV